MQSTWSESWMSSEFITTKIAFTSRSVAALQEKDLANRRPPMPSLITTLGGTIAAVCSRCQSQRNYEFATHRQILAVLHCDFRRRNSRRWFGRLGCFDHAYR